MSSLPALGAADDTLSQTFLVAAFCAGVMGIMLQVGVEAWEQTHSRTANKLALWHSSPPARQLSAHCLCPCLLLPAWLSHLLDTSAPSLLSHLPQSKVAVWAGVFLMMAGWTHMPYTEAHDAMRMLMLTST